MIETLVFIEKYSSIFLDHSCVGYSCIRINCQACWRRRVNEKTIAKCTFEIAKDAFDMSKMRSAGVMHKQTGSLNRIRNIRASVCDILKRTNEAMVKTGVRNRITGGR
jgi:hypothetical protein